jgi:hypothetical protein
MMGKKVYLKNFEQYDVVLEYDIDLGSHQILSRGFVDQEGKGFTFGTFSIENNDVAGVLSSPNGPIFFKNEIRILGSIESIEIKNQACAEPNFRHFSLWSKFQPVFDLIYRDRNEIETNPYDTERDDVDMFSMLANATKKSQFFVNYTKQWI